MPAGPFLCPETRHGQRHDHHLAVIIKVFLCLETAHSHVLKLDTSERAQVTGPGHRRHVFGDQPGAAQVVHGEGPVRAHGSRIGCGDADGDGQEIGRRGHRRAVRNRRAPAAAFTGPTSPPSRSGGPTWTAAASTRASSPAPAARTRPGWRWTAETSTGPTTTSAQARSARPNLDGTGVNQSFITGASFPWGVAVSL